MAGGKKRRDEGVYKPLCVVDLWDQADVCHGDLGGEQSVRCVLCTYHLSVE